MDLAIDRDEDGQPVRLLVRTGMAACPCGPKNQPPRGPHVRSTHLDWWTTEVACQRCGRTGVLSTRREGTEA